MGAVLDRAAGRLRGADADVGIVLFFSLSLTQLNSFIKVPE